MNVRSAYPALVTCRLRALGHTAVAAQASSQLDNFVFSRPAVGFGPSIRSLAAPHSWT